MESEAFSLLLVVKSQEYLVTVSGSIRSLIAPGSVTSRLSQHHVTQNDLISTVASAR